MAAYYRLHSADENGPWDAYDKKKTDRVLFLGASRYGYVLVMCVRLQNAPIYFKWCSIMAPLLPHNILPHLFSFYRNLGAT